MRASAPAILSLLAFGLRAASAQEPPLPSPVPLSSAFVSSSGVFPALSTGSESAPKRSEAGHGAMMSWADRLWLVTYLSVPKAGNGTGLYSIDSNLVMTKVASHDSCYANRLLIPGMNSIVIGPYVIDDAGNVRVLEQLLSVRVGGMAAHIHFPQTMVYMLGMDGPLWECDLVSLNCTLLYDLVKELGIPPDQQVHMKAAHTMAGTLWIASNTFDEEDFVGTAHGGRLATWQGNATSPWVILEETAFTEVTGRYNFGQVVFALGWDDASVILKVVDNGADEVSYDKSVQTYRLPKASHAYDHLWTTEWPRIREVETERFLMDMHGMFYELPPFAWGGGVFGIKPVSQHLRMVPDYCSFRGFLVLGGNQVSSIFDNNLVTGQSQSGLFFGKTDDLWSFGKPQGWGGPWLYDLVAANAPSDPYLMTGFDKKMVHMRAEGLAPADTVTISIEVDFTGSAGHVGRYGFTAPWNALTTVELTGAKPYAYYVFEPGFSAHWVRFVSDTAGNLTAWLTYT